jgi:hypothetical protein
MIHHCKVSSTVRYIAAPILLPTVETKCGIYTPATKSSKPTIQSDKYFLMTVPKRVNYITL